jgi:hypothetical protein
VVETEPRAPSIPLQLGVASTPREVTACHEEAFEGVQFVDASGRHAEVGARTLELCRGIPVTVPGGEDSIVDRWPPVARDCPEKEMHWMRSYYEQCVPSGFEVVVRACLRSGRLEPCGDGEDAVWRPRDVPMRRLVVDRRFFAGTGLTSLLPLLLGCWYILRRRRDRDSAAS